jgi:hypothetical protein
MDQQRGFPSKLLTESASVRIEYFVNYTSAHPLLDQAACELRNAIHHALPGSLILVCGPTGTGKTTLRLRTEARIAKEMLQELESDPEKIPILGVDAASPTSGNFSWRDFFRRILFALNEPCVDKKMIPGRVARLEHSDRSSEAVLRFAAEQALRFRRPLALNIDEAQHIAKISSGRKLHDQLDALKSFATMARLPIVLVGTYELIPFRNLSGQLSRRSIDIHLRRYDPRNEADVKAFMRVLKSFQEKLPLRDEPNLIPYTDFFFERSLGCIGILKDWLTTVLKNALESDLHTIDQSILEKHALRVPQCQKILEEIKVGESKFRENPESRELLRQGLGLESFKRKSDVKANINEKRTSSTTTRAVGKRNPIRDVVGCSSERQ